MRRPASLLVVAALALVGCGDDEATTGSPTDTADSTTSTAAPSSTTDPTTPDTLDDAELPGERIDMFPYAGDELIVVGVAADDTLNVRAAPGTDHAVVTELDPLDDGVVATGHNRSLGDEGIWSEVRVGGETGWASLRFLAFEGATDDVTTELGPLPTAGDMAALADVVAASFASTDPPSRVTIVDGPSSGDLEEVVVDVLGLGDDSVAGVRLHLFAERTADGVALRNLERTVLCGRGVTEDQACL
jgi:hypothetical protein